MKSPFVPLDEPCTSFWPSQTPETKVTVCYYCGHLKKNHIKY